MQMYSVLGVLLQFLATPEQVGDEICVMHGTLRPGVVIPLHSHADPEIFYMLEGELEVFRETDSGWSTAKAGDTVTIPGDVKHALRNTGSQPAVSVAVTKLGLYQFFRELAQPFDPKEAPARPTPEQMQQLFAVAKKYGYWLASPQENAAIGISLG